MVRRYPAGRAPRATWRIRRAAYAQARSRGLLRPDALRRWRDWRGRGARLVIVTATPEIIVAPFARGLGADALIGTRLEFDAEDRATGRLDGANCRGPEKVRRFGNAFGEASGWRRPMATATGTRDARVGGRGRLRCSASDHETRRAAALDGWSRCCASSATRGLAERSRGVFYRRSRAFLHFHEDPAGCSPTSAADGRSSTACGSMAAGRGGVLARVRWR